MKTTKKLLSILIAAIMAFSVAAIGASAATANIPSDAKVYNGHAYKLYNESYTWEEAEKYCENLGGHLVTITSTDEQNFINDELLENEYDKNQYWIGGYVSNNSWKWITGESFSYQHWSLDEPTDAYQHYIAIMGKNYDDKLAYTLHYSKDVCGFGFWLDNSNNDRSPWTVSETGFICEWDTDEVPAMSIWQRILNFFLTIINFILGLFK